jgi:hypothetical protein
LEQLIGLGDERSEDCRKDTRLWDNVNLFRSAEVKGIERIKTMYSQKEGEHPGFDSNLRASVDQPGTLRGHIWTI